MLLPNKKQILVCTNRIIFFEKCFRVILNVDQIWLQKYIDFHYLIGGGYSYGVAHGTPGNLGAALLAGTYYFKTWFHIYICNA